MKSQGKYIEHLFLSNKSYFIVVSVLSKPCLSQFLEKVYYKMCSYCARVCEGAHARMCTCMWRPELNGRYLPQLLSALRQVPSMNLVLTS